MRRNIILLTILCLLVGAMPAQAQIDLDDSIAHAWFVVNEHGETRVQNPHETRIVWHEGKLKIVKRVFSDGQTVLTVRWQGKIVARHLLPDGHTPILTGGEWQDYLHGVWCGYNPMNPDCT